MNGRRWARAKASAAMGDTASVLMTLPIPMKNLFHCRIVSATFSTRFDLVWLLALTRM